MINSYFGCSDSYNFMNYSTYTIFFFLLLSSWTFAQDSFERKIMGTAINTAYHESTPILSPDGQTLYVTRISHPENMGGNAADIWISKKQKDGTWSKLENIGAPLNNKGPNSLLALSNNGQTAWLSNQYADDGSLENAGLSFSRKTSVGWSKPERCMIDDFYLNSSYATYTVSMDDKVLVMGVERDDSKGLLDLYVSFREAENRWSKPLHMGAELNSPANEFAASLSQDTKLLYFVSEGHPGFGSADLFVSRRLDDTWQSWSKPQNLGTSINSDKWDSFLCLQETGKFALMVSQKEHNASLDLYEIALPSFAQANPMRIIRGQIFNKETKDKLDASIQINGESLQESISGNFEIELASTERHQLLISKSGYYSEQEIIPIGEEMLELVVNLIPLKEGEEIHLKNVHFEANKTTILGASKLELEQLLNMMQSYPEMEIEIAGHTSGHTIELQLLSEQRAEAIQDYLIREGIPKNRIKTIGFGGTKALVPNDTEANKQKNRRVSFKILKMN